MWPLLALANGCRGCNEAGTPAADSDHQAGGEIHSRGSREVENARFLRRMTRRILRWQALGIEPMFDSAKKLGVWKPGHKRPAPVTLEIVRKPHLLRQILELKTVYMTGRTLDQRKLHRELVGELTQRRAEKRPCDEIVRFVIRDVEVITLHRSRD